MNTKSLLVVSSIGITLFSCATSCLIAQSAAVDTTYNPALSSFDNLDANARVNNVSIQADDKVIIGGAFKQPVKAIARINTNGTVDFSYQAAGDDTDSSSGSVYALGSISHRLDGKAIFTGYFNRISGSGTRHIALLNSNGTIDPNFDSPSFSPVDNTSNDKFFLNFPHAKPLPNNQVFVWRRFEEIDPLNFKGLVKIDSKGQPLQSFKTETSGATDLGFEIYTANPQLDGKVIIGGRFATVNNTSRAYIARVNSDGSLDPTFTPPAFNGSVTSIVIQPDGKYLVGGYFSGSLVRLNTDGSADSSFDADVSSSFSLNSINLRADGNIVATGASGLIAQIYVLDSNGAAVSYYSGLNITGNYLLGSAIQSDGKIVLCGEFTSINSLARNGIARLNADVPAVATVEMSNPDGTVARWMRSGSAPEVDNVVFDVSTNNGITFTKAVGNVARIPGGWELTGSALPGGVNFILRARGQSTCGYYTSSLSLHESKNTFNRPKPVITAQPAPSQQVILGEVVTPTLSVTATSDATITGYQWKRNGVKITGATSSSYSLLGPISTSSAGKYTVDVISTAGKTTSQTANVLLVVPVAITTQPVPKVVGVGKSAKFSVKVTGTTPAYQWQKQDPVNPLVFTDIASATKSSFTIPSCQLTDKGNYRCKVSNVAGVAYDQYSAVVALAVTTGIPVFDTLTTDDPEVVDLPDGMVGAPYLYQLPMIDDLVAANDDNQLTAATYTTKGLPAGLKIDNFGLISGTPTKGTLVPTTYTVTITAANAQGKVLVPYTEIITINPIPGAMVGTWVGLVSRDPLLGDDFGGKLDLTVTAVGSYSGKVTLGTVAYSFTKGDLQVTNSSNLTNSILIKRKSPLIPLTLTLDINDTTNLLTGTLSDGTTTLTVEGWRNKWTKVVPDLATNYAGSYNIVMTPPTLPASTYTHPLGYSIAQIKVVEKAGTFTGSFKMADGLTAKTWSGFVGPSGELAFFQGFTTVSSVHGKLQITPVGTAPAFDDSTIAGNITWLRKPQTSSKVRSYKAGFSPLAHTVDGQKYLAPVPGSNLFNSTVNVDNINLAFTEAPDVTTSPNTVCKISDKNKVTMQPLSSGLNLASTSLSVTASNGLVKGSFKQPPETRKGSFTGVVLRTGVTGVGEAFGYFTLNQLPFVGPPATTATTSPNVSGKVEIMVLP